MTEKWYRFHCEVCNYNRITNGEDIGDMVEIKPGQVQTKIPKLDPRTGKTVTTPFKKLNRRWKCPKCGRLIFPKFVHLPPRPVEEKKDEDDFETNKNEK